MQFLQAGSRHMGVYLGGREVTVAQEHLYHPQVGAMIKQMCGKRVSQSVW